MSFTLYSKVNDRFCSRNVFSSSGFISVGAKMHISARMTIESDGAAALDSKRQT